MLFLFYSMVVIFQIYSLWNCGYVWAFRRKVTMWFWREGNVFAAEYDFKNDISCQK